jgi:hypothetical protein
VTTTLPEGGPLAELQRRPTFEAASAEYTAMLDEMRTALTQINPALRWTSPKTTARGNGCLPPFDDVKAAASAIVDTGGADGNVSVADWPKALTALTEIAARHRFTHVQVLVADASRHVVVFKDDWGGSVELGSQIDTSLGVISGCFIQEHPVVYRPDPTTPSVS